MKPATKAPVVLREKICKKKSETGFVKKAEGHSCFVFNSFAVETTRKLAI